MGFHNVDPLPFDEEPLQAPRDLGFGDDRPWLDLACRLFLWVLVLVAGVVLLLT